MSKSLKIILAILGSLILSETALAERKVYFTPSAVAADVFAYETESPYADCVFGRDSSVITTYPGSHNTIYVFLGTPSYSSKSIRFVDGYAPYESSVSCLDP